MELSKYRITFQEGNLEKLDSSLEGIKGESQRGSWGKEIDFFSKKAMIMGKLSY